MNHLDYNKAKNKINEIADLQDSRQEKYHSWLKNIITVALGFLGILVSLRSKESNNYYESLFFIFTVISLAVGIFSGIIVLYSEIKLLEKARRKKQAYLKKMIDGINKNFEFEMIPRGKFFDIMEKICFIAFSASLVFLVLYSINSENISLN